MLRYLDQLFSGGLAPHGYCLAWRPGLLWTHVTSDALIALAYFSIPIALASFLSRRRDMVFSWLIWLFALFIMACGTTHIMNIWTLWHPDYGAEGVVKAVTAVASVGTAIAMFPLIPKALALPSPSQLAAANSALQQGICERDRLLGELRREQEERARAQAMLIQAQKMEAIGQYTGAIAHDFNNMLMIVSGNLERAARLLANGRGEDAEHALARATEGTDAAARLTGQLLAYARRAPLQAQVQNLEEIIRATVRIAESTLEGVEIRTEIPPDLWPVALDRSAAEAALLNLLVNARDAMPNGGMVRISARTIDDAELAGGVRDAVEISVEDTGEGMSEDTKQRAFDPFFTTKPFGKGTGMGLSQVYGFVTQSGGEVLLSSRPGEGTKVTMLLPRYVQ